MAKTKSGNGPGSGRTTQSWQKSSKVSKNKVRQATCRYCQITVAAQNYPRHLRLAHRADWEENPRDIREFGDRALSFFNPASSEGAGAGGGEPGGGEPGGGEPGRGEPSGGEPGGGEPGGGEPTGSSQDWPV